MLVLRLELRLAALAAEVDRLASMEERRRARHRGHGHAADRIDRQWCGLRGARTGDDGSARAVGDGGTLVPAHGVLFMNNRNQLFALATNAGTK